LCEEEVVKRIVLVNLALVREPTKEKWVHKKTFKPFPMFSVIPDFLPSEVLF
jgi:hypothetical protein